MRAVTGKVLAASILARLEEADEDLGRFIKVSGWLEAGNESFTDWWKVQALPVLDKLMYLNISLKPEVRDVVLKQVVAEDSERPKAQRHTQRELGNLVGVHEDTVQKSKISPTRSGPGDTDLEPPRRSDKVDWAKAEQMARDGSSFAEIGRAVGVNESTVRRDTAVREARSGHKPEIDVQPTIRNYDKTIACDIEPAKELIREMDLAARRLLSPVYTLSKGDKQKIRAIAQKVLDTLEDK